MQATNLRYEHAEVKRLSTDEETGIPLDEPFWVLMEFFHSGFTPGAIRTTTLNLEGMPLIAVLNHLNRCEQWEVVSVLTPYHAFLRRAV